jgi:hypothetical protein
MEAAMEKIVVISSDQERSRNLLKWLELLFPECLIELLPGKDVNDPGRFVHENIGWGE